MRVRVGVIGCGAVARERHLPALRAVRGAEVVAVADLDPARLRSVGGEFGVARRFADFRELLEGAGVDAVAVCVPPRLHAEVGLAALDAGKHLLLEKPPALSLEECDLLAARAARSTLKAMVGFNLRWHRLVREAREVIRGGRLGPLKMIRTVFTCGTRHGTHSDGWRLRREEGGGALFDLAVHHFDLLRFLLGGEVEEVSAESRAGDETVAVSARMGDGTLVSSAFCEGTGDSQEVEVYGQRGRLRVSFYRADGLEQFSPTDYGGAAGVRARRALAALGGLPRLIGRARRGGDFADSYRAEWQHFVESIRRDTPVEATLEDGRRALAATLAAAQSASLKRAVRVCEKAET